MFFMDEYFTSKSTLHVAIIMDGNGRWAEARGLPRIAGHRAGAGAVRRTVEAAPGLGVGVLSLFAFSSDNWKRPAGEVDALMRLLREYIEKQTARSASEGVRLEYIGRRDRLDLALTEAMAASERRTASGGKMRMRIAVDYSGRDAIARAAAAGGDPGLRLGPPVDLLIRTGGERRLSDFLLWESAYAELIFTRRMWPDFGAADLEAAIREFHSRDRRFGAAPVRPGASEFRARPHAWLE